MHDAGYRLYDEVPRGSLRKHGLMHDRRDGVTIDGLLAGLVCADNPSYGSHDGRTVRDDRSRSRVRKRAEALLVAGAPCSGKTAFATDLLLGALRVFGDGGVGTPKRGPDRQRGHPARGLHLAGPSGHHAVRDRIPADHRREDPSRSAGPEIAQWRRAGCAVAPGDRRSCAACAIGRPLPDLRAAARILRG